MKARSLSVLLGAAVLASLMSQTVVGAETDHPRTIAVSGQGEVQAEPDQVELVGEACTQVQAGEDALAINFPCSVFTPVVK